MFCSRCFNKPTVDNKDDGEWIEPIKIKKEKGPAGQTRPSLGAPRASMKFELLRDFIVEEKQQKSIRWSDVTDPSTLTGSLNSGFDSTQTNRVSESSTLGDVEDNDTDEEYTSGPDGGVRRTSARSSGSKRAAVRQTASALRERLTFQTHATTDQNERPTSPSPSSGPPKAEEPSFLKKRMTLLKMQEPAVDLTAMKHFFEGAKSYISRSDSEGESKGPKIPAVTSIAVLSEGFFLTASRSGERVIKMYKTVEGGGVELVREFTGHKSGVFALVPLDRKGRFLSAGMDKTVRLWDSRFDCEEELDDEGKILQEPLTLLATFNCFDRLIYSIGVLREGSYVRPTDEVDMAMLTAMAKKTALEGAAAVQRAAIQREIIECSGSFATLSRSDKKIKLWDMTVLDKTGGNLPNENVAKINIDNELEHDVSIGAMAVGHNLILAGDIMGVIMMWERSKRKTLAPWGSSASQWTKLHKLTPWKTGALHSPKDIAKQSILQLCILDRGTFVSASKSGTVRVWDNIGSAKSYEVYKKRHAQGMKITNETVSGIQKLPPVKDPNTGEECLAFSASSTDGHVMSMALYPRDVSKKVQHGQLVMFHVYDNEPIDENSKAVPAIESIALSEAFTSTNGTSFDAVVIAGDGHGDIKTLNPEWTAVAIS